MNIFQKAIIASKAKNICFVCEAEFLSDKRNKKRGWGLFCSKSCSAKWRNKKKTTQEIRGYNIARLGI